MLTRKNGCEVCSQTDGSAAVAWQSGRFDMIADALLYAVRLTEWEVGRCTTSVCEKTSHRFFRGKFYSNNNTNTSNNILVISRTKPL